MIPELTLLNGRLSDPQTINVGVHSSILLSDETSRHLIKQEQALKAQISYLKKWSKFCRCLLLLQWCLSRSVDLWSSGEFSVMSEQRREDWSPQTQMSQHGMQAPSERGHLLPYSSALWHSWRTLVMGKPFSGQNFEPHTWLVTLFGKRKGQVCNYIPVHWLWPMV